MMEAFDGHACAASSGVAPSSLLGRIRRGFTERKQRMLEETESQASEREAWIARHRFFYDEDWRYMRFLVPQGKRVLDLGCGAGELLNAVQPAEGIGVDFSQAMIDRAKIGFPALTFVRGDAENLEDVAGIEGEFDIIIMSDTIGSLDDCLETFRSLKRFCKPQTRVIVTYQSRIWEPLILLHAWLTTKQPVLLRNWLSSQDIANLLDLADFDVIKREWRILCPLHLFGLGSLINRYIATLPLIRKICLRNYVVARPQPQRPLGDLSTTIVVPCRNERDNIEAAVQRIPDFCTRKEIIFVEGGSSDGTWERIQQVIADYPQVDIKALKQTGTGKGDAVRYGFAEANGEVLMILDADLTMPPEDLPKFYTVLASGKGEFVNGSRLVYPMEKQAMRLLNLLANYIFAQLFTYLLNQRHTDTLCGTKALLRESYNEISRNRAYFGDFDPFGDFDLLFGANKLNLKTAEVPIRYAARTYGETQISRFRHGWLLLRMVCFAFKKLKAL
jgi:SAM-dependent methyltransferase